jgi:hypothetical protein
MCRSGIDGNEEVSGQSHVNRHPLMDAGRNTVVPSAQATRAKDEAHAAELEREFSGHGARNVLR